jgi:hypothetical protein
MIVRTHLGTHLGTPGVARSAPLTIAGYFVRVFRERDTALTCCCATFTCSACPIVTFGCGGNSPRLDWDDLGKHGEGLICLAGGPPSVGLLAYCVEQAEDPDEPAEAPLAARSLADAMGRRGRGSRRAAVRLRPRSERGNRPRWTGVAIGSAQQLRRPGVVLLSERELASRQAGPGERTQLDEQQQVLAADNSPINLAAEVQQDLESAEGLPSNQDVT